MAPGVPGGSRIGLQECLARRGRGHGLLSLADMGQGVSHPMHAAALPRRPEDTGDRPLPPFMSIGDDKLHTLQTTLHQAFEEGGPQRLRLGRADVQTGDLTPSLGVAGRGDDRRDRHYAPAALRNRGPWPPASTKAISGKNGAVRAVRLQPNLLDLIEVYPLTAIGDAAADGGRGTALDCEHEHITSHMNLHII